MFFIINMSLTLFLLAIFVPIFFIFQKIRILSVVLNSNIPKIIGDITESLLYGALFIGIQVLSTNMSGSAINYLYIVGALTLYTVKGHIYSFISMVPGLVFYMLVNEYSQPFYILLATVFIFMATYEIYNFFFKNIWSKLFTFGTILVWTFIMLFVASYALGMSLTSETFEMQMLPFMMTMLSTAIFVYLINFSVSANILYESSSYVVEKYYREALSYKAIGEYISANKTVYAVYGILNIDFALKKSEEKNELIKRSVLKAIQNELPNDAVLFEDTNKYGFFIGMKDSNNETTKVKIVKTISDALGKVSRKYNTQQARQTKVNVTSSIAFYGLDTSSINDLREYVHFTNEIPFKKINVHQFDHKKYKGHMKNIWNVDNLDNFVSLDNYINKYFPVYDFATKKSEYVFCNVENISDTQYIDDIREYMDDINMATVFERFFATDVMKTMNKLNSIYIYSYPSLYLSSDFNIVDFIEIINRNNIKRKSIHFFIRMNESENNAILKKNILELMGEGIGFVVNGKDIPLFKKMTKMNPNLAIVMPNSKDEINRNIKTISPNISSDQEFNLLRENNNKVTLVSGSLFGSDIFPTKFSKQSKIYLEKLLKEKK